MQTIKFINQITAFLLEIFMFISLGYLGFIKGKTLLWKYVFLIGLPLIAITLWGFFAAPNSTYRLGHTQRIFFESALFVLTAIFFYKSGYTTLALFFGVIVVLSEAIAFFFNQ
jgi:Protein of unknown function (DUF2568)